ncbi:hypothetical protein MYCTH_2300555 [Thermothelomyces thermophilus ATCC 42464]|uniref:ornithine decarboxylase n=1 Tax=Thermothelomyces thermophilus (strain ATCC 42464 / BCRC 31852 / DSM 1799) TaxID=573729 RepID=G2Q7L2_THET4|nr:uncharacterized protein MYCTH_2300555 [Thermothelomyces thermophilus ATCC 42464]AEO56070.1 hypothetical protein MYCTH_2300555 [Thermothelomyces thermophilus ATCC 42464]
MMTPAAAELLSHERVDVLIRRRIAELRETPFAPEADLPFVVADSTRTLGQHQRWMHHLPHIQPFYAVKCNSDAHLLRFLADLGLGFDCASPAEIELVLGLGVNPSRIVYTHPCKAASALHMASDRGVLLTTFDNADELDKIASVSPDMRLLLRIYADDETAAVCLSNKFGASLHATRPLLLKARALGLQVVGVCFHIGSGATDPKALHAAVRDARRIFDQARDVGFDLTILDVGGGFTDANFEAMASALRLAIESEFPSGDRVRIIAEPGRFYARSFYTLACKIIARRTHDHDNNDDDGDGTGAVDGPQLDMLYQNDGVYGCFMNRLVEDEVFVPTLIPVDDDDKEEKDQPGAPPRRARAQGKHLYSVWGPTCDGFDCVSERATLPCEARIGDWLKYTDMGAYSVTCATTFNGFPNTYEILYVNPGPEVVYRNGENRS